MSLSDNYRQLAALIEALESQGVTVQQAIPVVDGEQESPADEFIVRLEVGIPDGETVPTLTRSSSFESEAGTDTAPNATGASEPVDSTAPTDATDDTAESDGDAPTADDTAENDDEAQPSEAPADPTTATSKDHESSEAVVCTAPDCDRTFETERGMKIHRTKAHPLSEVGDRTDDESMHHDPAALERVYRDHETFAEMTDALEVDVGAQAVRKQMIRHGIHEPGGGDSKAASTDDPKDETGTKRENQSQNEDDSIAADDGEEPLPPLDLPEDLTAAELKAAVEDANTLYDVQRALGLDHDTTHEILCEYDLLDLVTGRASTARDRQEQKAEVNERLKRTAT